MEESSNFRVVIAGGGVAGLTLASALDKANIDFVLLEAHEDIAPQVGASIGILVNGMRIADQLGCFEEVAAGMEPLLHLGDHYTNGDYIYPKSDMIQLGAKRNNYDAVFVDRQLLLQALANSIVRKDRIVLNKRISHVEHSESGVVVHCKDGTRYDGAILAGSDGVKSATRREMWRLAGAVEPDYFSEKEKNAMFAEYQCLFGIATKTEGLPLNSFDVTYCKGHSSMMVTGKEGRVYYFMYKQLDRIYHANEIPRYTNAEAIAYAEEMAEVNFMPKGSVKFKDIWKNTITYSLVALEEARYDHWTWGRIACLGDSIHKITPNAGAGGNASMESAAALANSINQLLLESKGRDPSLQEVEKCLQRYQKVRQPRCEAVMVGANGLTRIQALKTFSDRIVAHYVLPNAGDVLMDMQAELLVGATKIDFLPPPPASLKGYLPFNPEQGVSKTESKLRRALLALPFLIIFALSLVAMDGSGLAKPLTEFATTGHIVTAAGSDKLIQDFYHVKFFDTLWRFPVMAFTPSMYDWDNIGRWQLLNMLPDVGLIYTIWLIESARRASNLTFAQAPVLFGFIFQLRGIGPISCLYYFFHYISTQISVFKTLDNRLTDLSYTSSTLISVLLLYYVPFIGSYFAPNLHDRQLWNWVWQPFPIWIALFQRLVRAMGLSLNTIMYDRIHAPLRDLKWIKSTTAVVSVISTATYIYTTVKSPYNLLQLHLPVAWSANPAMLADQSFISVVREIIRWDAVLMYGNTYLWLAYMFWDLKHAGMLRENWTMIAVKGLAATLLLGPGAAIALGWYVREEMLATRRHKGAIIAGQNDQATMRKAGDMMTEKTSGSNGHASSNGHVKR